MSFLKHTILEFFLIFFFRIKLPNRVPLNHPIAATKTLTFSVILFELPSEHCACGHGFIGFAEPMSPLRFMHTHSYLLIIPCTDSLAILLRLRPPTGMSSSDATAISSTGSSSSEDQHQTIISHDVMMENKMQSRNPMFSVHGSHVRTRRIHF